jgi:ATP-dependent exoDNAse (exonuclease V) alpha subunit
MSYRYTDRFAVVERRAMEVATGDRLQLKLNARSREGSRISNGELVTVRQISTEARIKVEGADGKIKSLSPHLFVFQRGYAVTSYGSQGKTVDAVLFADAANQAATSAQQWYVTISRGRKRVVVITSNKEALRASITQLGSRDLAMDLSSGAAGVTQAQNESYRYNQAVAARMRVTEAVRHKPIHRQGVAL